MIENYTKEIKAIQWDGKKETLDLLIFDYVNFISAWMVDGNNPPTKNSLRISRIKTQGDFWVDIGDYIELKENDVFCHKKVYFEKTYLKKLLEI